MSKHKAISRIKNHRRPRGLHLERLEDRTLLAGDWQNPVNPLDVDDSGLVTSLDVLLAINAIFRDGSHKLEAPESGVATPPFLDVNGNDFIDPIDPLLVINFLNTSPPEGLSLQSFHVNVETGKVDVGPVKSNPADGSEGESYFTGSTIAFNSTQLVDDPGDAGRKILNVSLTNHKGEPIGKLSNGDVTGLRVLFSPFTNVGAFSDLRTKSSVSTVAGTGATSSVDGPVGSATIHNPTGTAVDGNGDVYVAEFGGNKIRKISNGFVSTLAGSGVAGSTDGSGTFATFNNPWGIARNPVDGAWIVTEFSGHRIRRVDMDGTVTTIAGTGGLGDVNGVGTLATFRNPAGVTVGIDGTIYVVESTGQRLRKIVKTADADPRLPASYTVSVLAGSVSPPVAGSADGVGSSARFNLPHGVAVDSAGTVYVADGGNNRIRRVTANGEVVTIAGTGGTGNTDGLGNQATFVSPQAIAIFDDTTLLVSDTGSHYLRQIALRPGRAPASASSWQVGTIAGTGAAGAADGAGNSATFHFPRGIAVDSNHNAFVADFTNNKIRELTPTNGFFPLGNPTGAAPADAVSLANPDGMIPVSQSQPGERPFIKYAGALAHNETSVTQGWSFIVPAGVSAFEFSVAVEANTSFLAPPVGVSNPGPGGVGSPNNIVRTVAGQMTSGFANGMGTEAAFKVMQGIAVDEDGNRYVADTYNHSIRQITPDGIVTTVNGVVGKGPGSADGDGPVAQFNFPQGVAVYPNGSNTRLIIADRNNNTIRQAVYVGRWIVNTIAGQAGVAGYVDNTTGDLARFSGPFGVTVSDGGIIYVTEYDGNRVRRIEQIGSSPYSATSYYVSLVAGSTTGASGNTDGSSSAARFNGPAHIATDAAGTLYVADALNNQIRKISTVGVVSTLAGSTYGYGDGLGTAAKFARPYGIAVDRAGYVYVADTENHRIRRISPSGVVTTVAGTGNNFPAVDLDGRGDTATFYNPYGIAVDDSGSLHVTSGSSYALDGGPVVGANGTRIRLIERIFAVGEE